MDRGQDPRGTGNGEMKQECTGDGGKRLLVSDIDGTLLRGGEPTPGLITLHRLLEGERDRIRLVYATGRSFHSTWSLVQQDILPAPDGIAALVGSEVWLPPWNGPDGAYARFIGSHWDRSAVEETVGHLSDLEEQPPDFQTPHKLSYFVSREGIDAKLRDMLAQRGIRARVIHSGGKYLDILPHGAGKKAASSWIRCRLCNGCDRTMACGDSLNDLDILEDPDLDGVTVGNAETDLLRALQEDHVYHARLPYAAGVIEGAEALHFWP